MIELSYAPNSPIKWLRAFFSRLAFFTVPHKQRFVSSMAFSIYEVIGVAVSKTNQLTSDTSDFVTKETFARRLTSQNKQNLQVMLTRTVTLMSEMILSFCFTINLSQGQLSFDEELHRVLPPV